MYLGFSVLQVIANVMAMIFTADIHSGGGLGGLWDVAAVYMETVLVFMFIYVFIDAQHAPAAPSCGPAVRGNRHRSRT
jgi:hypothetical protein